MNSMNITTGFSVRLKICFLLTWSCLFCLVPGFSQTNIANYKVYLATSNYRGSEVMIIRKFEQNGTPSYLYVDFNTLKSGILPVSKLAAKPGSWSQVMHTFSGTAYVRSLEEVQGQSFSMQNAGIIHGYPKEKGITLTIDLCPSHKPLDRVIFSSLIKEFKKIEKPVPLALSVSGRFMLTHGADLNWLKGLEKSGDLEITWVNHTYNHHYNPNVPLQDNFLLAPGTDLDFEILGTEIAMLQNGMMPAVFFRFPGLVSDNRIVSKVTAYGLIPIGSDAWLAKGQAAQAGSIVLIHGNGNEPIGVQDFLKLLKNEQQQVQQKQWLLYDLRESVDNEFKE